MGDTYIGRKIMAWALAAIAVMVGFSIVKSVAYGDIGSLAILLALTFTVAWTFSARDNWWFALPAAVSFGGFFFSGFRIMLYEIGMVLCLLPLALSVLSAPQRMLTQGRRRSALPYILLAYVLAHCALSMLRARAAGEYGMGSVFRVYFAALWPPAFVIVFLLYGRTHRLAAALRLVYGMALLRVVLGTLALVVPQMLYLPGINLVLPTAVMGSTDLRYSALMFVLFSLCYARMTRNRVVRGLHIAMIVLSGVLVSFGAGRIGFVMYLFSIVFFLAVHRQRALLTCLLSVLAAAVIVLNAAPDSLYRLPSPVRRALSSLVIHSKFSTVHEDVRLSDVWHFELARRGRLEWLKSPLTFFFGNRIRPFSKDFDAYSATLFTRLDVAAGMGTYESGLWTVLACTGVLGALLYIGLFLFLCRDPWRQLRAHGIRDVAYAFYFLAVCRTIMWVAFSWIAGHFPTDELMFAAIAKAAADDRRPGGDASCMLDRGETDLPGDVGRESPT